MQRVEVSFAKKQAVVRYEPGKVSVEEMVAAIANVGFSASLHQ